MKSASDWYTSSGVETFWAAASRLSEKKNDYWNLGVMNGEGRYGSVGTTLPLPTNHSDSSHEYPRAGRTLRRSWEELSVAGKATFYPDANGEANSLATNIESQRGRSDKSVSFISRGQ